MMSFAPVSYTHLDVYKRQGVLRRMYELGVRMMTLTWNHENELASPQRNPGGVQMCIRDSH